MQNRLSSRHWWLVFSLCSLLLSGITFTSLALQQSLLQTTMSERYGEDGERMLSAWFDVLSQLDSKPTTERLTLINDFFNRRLIYSDDRLLWKQKDYWATPLQTMGVRGGDCEDFTIAKYFSLLQTGLKPEKLRLIYVRATTNGASQAHMVLGYFASPDAEPLILDNLNPTILPASERPDLTPVFSFNSEGLWLGGKRSESDPTARLSRWRDVLQRMRNEGF